MEYEGEARPVANDHEQLAFKVHAMLRNGQGGIDWSGFDLATQWLGVEDVDMLIHRLLVINLYRRPDEGALVSEE